MIKVEIINGQTNSHIKGRPDDIAIEFETICENLLEQGYFNANDLTCMLAVACSEKSVERITWTSKQALINLLKKL